MACPQPCCGGPNLEGFRFCRWCGEARRLAIVVEGPSARRAVLDKAVAVRLREVLSRFDDKAHERSKDAEIERFAVFLATRDTVELRRQSVFDASPQDVVDFLVYRDLSGAGRTVEHRGDFVRRADKQCGCPSRMAQSAVRRSSALSWRIWVRGDRGIK